MKKRSYFLIILLFLFVSCNNDKRSFQIERNEISSLKTEKVNQTKISDKRFDENSMLAVSGVVAKQKLVWSDEFEGESLNMDNWVYETGDLGVNNELQRYTNRRENIKVENGLLKITARAERLDGNEYTSARIKTQGKREFTFGAMEAKIKLALGQGTWPAFWMLGANIDEVGWPNCGEIDIMEYVGKHPIRTFSNVFFPNNVGENNTTSRFIDLEGLDKGFHVFRAEWDARKIVFKVDGITYNTFTIQDGSLFRDQFFFILNVAMGGDFGGSVPTSFSEATMEVDYIRVYQ